MSYTSNSKIPLKDLIQGTWWLLSRIDVTKDGQERNDPILGSDPSAILVYAKDYFAAQFMKKDRTSDSIPIPTNAGQNNTGAVGGYDAYFGTYKIDETTSLVAHTLIGSLNPGNIGMTVYRKLQVNDNRLTIMLDTTSHVGEPIIRTLTWRRIS
jgi:lipocalin-like protein